ncbi:hypothetical protein FOA52_008370 [Chlamydomonas sp. UWO 241]|nr:hypothetical protein FOA52_008370 [Chlamydomonas sp. UWO 241]
MATGWLRGVVKEVPSGDTVVIAGNVKSGPPPEMRITLSSLVCPRMGRRDGTTRDEPFAWASREFLRKKVIGQQVTFKVDYTVEAIGNRPFGSVFLGEKDNVALSVVAAGWCKVRSQGKEQSPYIEDLKKAEEAATLAGRGMWTKDEAELATAIRDGSDDFDASIFMAETGKGTVVQAVVEGVMNGSMMRVTMLPSGQTATIQVCGAQCPSMGRRAPGATGEDGAPAPAAGVPTSAAAVAAMAPVVGTRATRATAAEAEMDAEVNAAAMLVILESLDESIQMVMMEEKTAFSMWAAVIEMMTANDAANRMSLVDDMIGSELTHGESATEYINRVHVMSKRLANAGVKLDPVLLVSMVLRGLPEPYSPFKVAMRASQAADYSLQTLNLLLTRAEADIQLASKESDRPIKFGTAMAVVHGASAAEPFAREAKHMAETRCLNREVTLIVEGVDKYNNLFATVMAPGADGEKESLAEALLKAGFAKVMDFSANMVSGGGQKLRDLERAAKLEKRALWTNYVPQASNSAKATDAFKGTVIEVVSGDCVVVKDEASRMERRVQISSLRAPRMSTRDRAADPWATEAKDFLRKKLIGQMVEVKMEYVRKLSSMGDSHGAPEREMAFGNVEVVPEKGEEKQNVGEMVVARGFAAVVRHRADEERSGVYDKLLECEELAKGAKRGVHGTKAPPPNRINDVSIPGSAAKAKQYLPFFQRGKLQASVEFVLSGHRLKLSIPKESAIITFAPSGIRTPSRAQPAGGGRPAVSGEPYADEAISFTRELCMQRDCEVSIETMDRGGGFLGTVSVSTAKGGQLDLALVLVKAGLARIQPGMDASMLTNGHALMEAQAAAQAARLKAGLARIQPGMDASMVTNRHALMEAQAAAQAARLKIWEKWSPEEAPVSADDSGAAGGSSGAPAEVLEVVVTEVEAADEFYIQVPTEPRLRWVCEQLAAVSDEDAPAIPPLLRAGQLCLGQFSLDNQWYRSYVERANTGKDTTYDVFFIDYGNRERLPASRVRTIDTALAAVPPQARQACLAYVRVPEPGAEHGPEARVCLAQLLGGGQALLAHVVSREAIPAGPGGKHPKNAGGKLHVQLLDADGGADVAAELLASGYATLPKLSKLRTAAAKAAVEKLQEFEEEARSARRGVFVYGDPGDSDDEAAAAPAKPVGAWGAKR